MEGQGSCSRLSACALGGGLGLLSALMVLILGVLAKFYSYGVAWLTMASSVYIGFASTPKGIAIGVAWAFVDGFVCGFLLAKFYNFIAKRCPCKSCRSEVK